MSVPQWFQCAALTILCLAGCHVTREAPSGLPCEVTYTAPCYPLPPVDLCQAACPEALPEAALAGPPLVLKTALPAQKTEQRLSLEEAREIALKNNKTIRVLGHLPQEAGTLVDASLAVFDPVYGFTAAGGRFRRQVADEIVTLGAVTSVQRSDFFGPTGLNSLFARQRFATGGEVSVGYGANYWNDEPVGAFSLLNPYWRSAINLNVTQPLLRGRGPEVTRAPIAIARANQNESLHLFQANVQQVLLDVELAYWNLVLAYRNVGTANEVLAMSEQTFEMEQERLRIGEGSIPDAAQAEDLYQVSRIRQSESLLQLAQANYQLRRMLGLPADDHQQLIPTREPIPSKIGVDWEAAVDSAQRRPELLAQQANVRSARVELALAQNLLKSDVALTFDYASTGLESDLNDSFSTAVGGEYFDWTAGILFQQSFGRRAERAAVRRAELALSRTTAAYRDLEHQVLHELTSAYQDLVANWQMLELYRRRREVAQLQLDARRELYQQRRTTLDLQLQAEVSYTEALLSESAALVAYEQSLVRWQYASGVTLCDHIVLAESVEPAHMPTIEPIDPPLPTPTP